MRLVSIFAQGRLPAFLGLLICCPLLQAGGEPWRTLDASADFKSWARPIGDWFEAGAVSLDQANPKKLVAKPGEGILVNGPKGRTQNLLSREKYGDLEVRLDFYIPKGSNSGVKFQGLYELQIFDSYGVKKLTGSDCGGVYPRAEMKPSYHHIDDGVAPRVNACKPAGQWQTLHAIFLAPRFGPDGKKIANARLVRADLNEQLIHENVELRSPTGHAWHEKEQSRGPLLLQADHGPVAFRNIQVRTPKEH